MRMFVPCRAVVRGNCNPFFAQTYPAEGNLPRRVMAVVKRGTATSTFSCLYPRMNAQTCGRCLPLA